MQGDITPSKRPRDGYPVSLTEMVCKRCTQLLPADVFQPDPRYKTGLQSWCKPCKRDRRREQFQTDPVLAERERQRQRNAHAANPEAARSKVRRSYQRHAEKRRAERRAYYLEHLEEERARSQAYNKTRPWGYDTEGHARRRAKRYGTYAERLDYRVILGRDDSVCHICHEVVPFKLVEMDHVIPLRAGGTHTYDNVKVAHARCNRLKIKADKRLPRVGKCA